MKKIAFTFILMFISFYAQATELNGTFAIKSPNYYFGSSSAVSANIDVVGNTFTMGDFKIYGVLATATAELLQPGTYTRTYVKSTGEVVTRTATIPSGATGVYLVISTNSNEYQAYIAWSISADGTTYSNIKIPGNTLIGGTLDGANIKVDLQSPPSSISVVINAPGGNTQECNQPGGTIVALDATTTLTGTAIVDRVDWELDGSLIAQGVSISQFIPLGVHTVSATGVTTTGLTDTATMTLTINDTTAPDLTIAFIDEFGNSVTTSSGNVQISLTATDICDPAPTVINSSATPITNVIDGDVIAIDSLTNNVQLPTTGVEVTANAVDASGRTSFARAILNIQ